MTKAEIIAELRRSAREDGCSYSIEWAAFYAALEMRAPGEPTFCYLQPDHWRTFYLFVACALEDE